MKNLEKGMERRFSVWACVFLFPIVAFSQNALNGILTDEITGEKIPGASIAVENSFVKTMTDADGNFKIVPWKDENTRIRITHIAYRDTLIELKSGEVPVGIKLQPKTILADEVSIVATRAGDQSAGAFTNIKREEIENQNLGQDLPYLISQTPSVVMTSDAGAGVGYTGIRIRGSDATRVNVTINGIPVNDAEGLLVYWVDLPDFASSVDNIQVQRGIGTSTNGAGAFGGSVNIQTSKLSTEPFATASSSFGSYNTNKNTVQFGTGLLHNQFAMEGRLSKIASDGYIDRATSDLKSFYLSGGYYGKKNSLRFVAFSGTEKTYQAWYGVPQDSLDTHRTYNLAGEYADANGRVQYYNNQTDNYQQDYYQLHYSYAANNSFNLNAALHYTKGKGYYEEYQPGQAFAEYLLDTLFIGRDTLSSTDLIRQRWLSNDFYGFTFSANYEKKNLKLSFGGAANTYRGRHYDEVIWAQYASNRGINFIYKDNVASKDDISLFAKLNYSLHTSLQVFADLQFRTISYSFLGFNDDATNAKQQVDLNFFNPKAGLNYKLNASNQFHLSLAVGHKEPVREDYTITKTSERPTPEAMTDVEAGYDFMNRNIRAGANLYYMNYQDQLVLTGQINDVGGYPRANADKSHRTGIELEFAWNILKNLQFSSNLTLSENKIKSIIEYVDSSDDVTYYPQVKTVHHNTDISFSPKVIGSATVMYSPCRNFSMQWNSKYVGKQYLDNASHPNRKLYDYYLSDIRLSYQMKPKLFKKINWTFAVYNVLGKKYESNGYTYSYYYSGSFTTANYYYPQAGRNWLAGVTVKF